MDNKNIVKLFSVEVRLEACYNMLIQANSEEEAINVAITEDLPARRIEDFQREVVRSAQMKGSVYLN